MASVPARVTVATVVSAAVVAVAVWIGDPHVGHGFSRADGSTFSVQSPSADAPRRIVELLKSMQAALFDRAKKFRDANSFEVNSYDEFKKKIEEPGGFLWAHWDGTRETEDRIAAETKATIRCIPFDRPKEAGKDLLTGKPSEGRVVFARAY